MRKSHIVQARVPVLAMAMAIAACASTACSGDDAEGLISALGAGDGGDAGQANDARPSEGNDATTLPPPDAATSGNDAGASPDSTVNDVDAGLDAAPVEAAADGASLDAADATALDATADGGADAQTSAPDAEPDAAPDAANDAAPAVDASSDAAIDAAPDAAADAAQDSGPDAAPDSSAPPLTTAGILQTTRGADCLACATANANDLCISATEDCESFGTQTADPDSPVAGQSRTTLCMNALSCVLSTSCSTKTSGVACYCGDNATCLSGGVADGACMQEEFDGLEAYDVIDVRTSFTDPTLGAGMANTIVACLWRNNCTSCFNTN